jgi:hypothetical protein
MQGYTFWILEVLALSPRVIFSFPIFFSLSSQASMGRDNVDPTDPPLGSILKYWECLDPTNLKKKGIFDILV